MKKLISYMLMFAILLTPLSTLAINIPGYEGGIQNENTYKEVIFVTGKPIVMEGTLTIKSKEKDNTITETYTYKLDNPKEDAKLTRTIKMTAHLEPKGNQISINRTLDSYRETIDVDGKRYEARKDDYPWNQGTITHNTPLLSYYAGDVAARKIYTVGRGEETVTVETQGKLVGYDSPWSATETQTIEYVIYGEDRLNPDRKWQGTATVEASYNKTKDYSYSENIPRQISFREGVTITEQHENVLKYDYDLPRMNGDQIQKGRNVGKDSFSIDTVPIITRLNIPQAKDIRGHGYEEELFLLASMEGLPLNNEYIGPDTFVSRGDFAKMIVKSMDIPIEEREEPKRKRGRRKQEPTPPMFKDVKTNHRNFDYIETVGKRGIMVGIDKNKFKPDAPLTRAEAYTIAIRLLGFKNLAPTNKNYTTGFKDDKSIPAWAKDNIYVARQLDILEGADYFYPNREITNGESAKLIVELIHYMQEDLKQDYRENILNN